MSTSTKDFQASLERARWAERLVARFVQETWGCGVLPTYEFNDKDGKAPAISFHGADDLIVPDLLVCDSGNGCPFMVWVEVKFKTEAPLNRTHGVHVHGVETRLLEHYRRIQSRTGQRVFVMVLERTGELLCAELDRLLEQPIDCQCVRCLSGQPGRRCMTYFPRSRFSLTHQFTSGDAPELRSVWPANEALGG